ncbi:unnamed protein product [Didymodactylos carnosus]|nr:unnamed protein product [Didymodactylos carnosus]
MAEYLADTVKLMASGQKVDSVEETTLDFGRYTDDEESEEEEESMLDEKESEEMDEDWKDKELALKKYNLRSFSQEFMRQVIDFIDHAGPRSKHGRSWKAIHHRLIPDRNYIPHFRKYLEHHGTKRQKTQDLYSLVYKKLVDARQKNLVVHDLDIQRWDLKIAKEIKLDDFHASHDGRLLETIYLCLQEQGGKMGEQVKRHLFQPKNVVITCSASGKLTASLVKYWRDNRFLPLVGAKCLLLSDSYPGQNRKELDQLKNCGGKKVTRSQIPQNTTDELQPQDCYFTRQIKSFLKACYHRVALDELDMHLHERNNIIRLASLMHNQLSADVFM